MSKKSNQKTGKMRRRTRRIRYKFFTKSKNKNNERKVNIDSELIKENMSKYSYKLSLNHLKLYSSQFLIDNLKDCSNQNKKIITEQILKKYNLTKEIRKNAIKYLYKFITYHKINTNCYFSSVWLFDTFLINYSEDEANANNCSTFFDSKTQNKFSLTKVYIFLFCCYYVSSHFFNIKIITIDQILAFENALNEFTYNDIYCLIEEIMTYTDLDIGLVNINNFIEIYMFDIMINFKEFTSNQLFLKNFEKYSSYFCVKIVQNLDLLSVKQNAQALGIIQFSLELSKLESNENNLRIDNYFNQWKKHFIQFDINFDRLGFESVITWLTNYVGNKLISN